MGRQRIIPTIQALFGLAASGGRRIVVPIAPAIGIAIGIVAALGFLAMPITVLEDMAVDSGVASLFTAAQPPLGTTARLAVAMFAGLAAGGLSWFGLSLLFGTRTMLIRRGWADDGVPVLRRADAHPDAPPRRPVFAHRDLGTPFLDVKAAPAVPEHRPLPLDLDTPMAIYRSPLDPPSRPDQRGPVTKPASEAKPAEPLPIVRQPDPVGPAPVTAASSVAPQPVPPPPPRPRFAAHERIETFVMPPAGTDPGTPLPQATIHDLLERLERGVAKTQPQPEPEPVVAPEPARETSLEETLAALRALASRVG